MSIDSPTDPDAGRRRVVVEGLAPEIDGGRFPAKRVLGDRFTVEADLFVDSHDRVSGRLLYRQAGTPEWYEVPLEPLVNDRWQATFELTALGRFEYTVCAWVDHFQTWHHDLERRVDPGDIAVALEVGALLLEDAADQAAPEQARRMNGFAAALRAPGQPLEVRRTVAHDPDLHTLMTNFGPRHHLTRYERILTVVVDPLRARFSSWYELFPRSAATEAGRHGTFADVEAQLPAIAAMGFDVLYLPPIHPIGHSQRKGRNNALAATADDVGSPWAIGNADGGHKSLHPQLGTLSDFLQLVVAAREHGLELALDIAFQCAPDHPYVREHPEWFRHRPDGSVQYAENPPKKYQDIYPLNFETEDWVGLWQELKSVFEYWIEQGVTIFRVDNPHTKPFVFWEWLITELKRDHPETIFLAEAFTRPKVMQRLAKVGFTQSYTYFAWRNTRHEIESYFTELTRTEQYDYFRPNVWPNTPDILPEYLQIGGRPAFVTRLVLAATLAATYGIYGPAFELQEHLPREPGSEEYLDSEKYQIRQWALDRADSLRDLIARVNRARHDHAALQTNETLAFHFIDNPELVCYSKHSADLDELVLVVVNLDPHHVQSGWVDLPLETLGLDLERPYQLHDLLSDARFLWHGSRNYVELDPHAVPAHIFRIRRETRTEQDFAYYL